jgi:hypothetical protein
MSTGHLTAIEFSLLAHQGVHPYGQASRNLQTGDQFEPRVLVLKGCNFLLLYYVLIEYINFGLGRGLNPLPLDLAN